MSGDRYAGEWPRERFREHGISYSPAEKTKSECYLDFLPMLNSGQVELLDHPRLIAQLLGLERRTARGGRDSVDHAPGGHDDVINAAAGVLVDVLRPSAWIVLSLDEDDAAADAAQADRRASEALNINGQVSRVIRQLQDESRGDGRCGECAHMHRRGGDEGECAVRCLIVGVNDPECDAFEPRSVE